MEKIPEGTAIDSEPMKISLDRPEFSKLDDSVYVEISKGGLRAFLNDAHETYEKLLAEKVGYISRVNAIQKDLSWLEAGFMRDVNDEVTEDGKKKFTNEDSRKAEVKRRALSDENYFKKNDELESFKFKLAEVDRKIEVFLMEVENKRVMLKSYV